MNTQILIFQTSLLLILGTMLLPFPVTLLVQRGELGGLQGMGQPYRAQETPDTEQLPLLHPTQEKP